MRLLRSCSLRILLPLLLGSAMLLVPVRAQPAVPLAVARNGTGVRVQWRGYVQADRSGAPFVPAWPTFDLGGAQLPARLIALRVADNTTVVPQIDQMSSAPWHSALPRARRPVPQTVSGDQRPDLIEPQLDSLPHAPAFVLRDGRLRGQRIVVLAVSPVFVADGQTRAATNIDVTVANADVLPDQMIDQITSSAPFVSNAPAPITFGPNAIKVRVTQGGMQGISGAALAAAGLDLAAPDRLHLRWQDHEIAIETRGTDDGRLDAADELRFYAPSPGDRWNAADTYWLTLESSAGQRIAPRGSDGTDATPRTARTQTTWRANAFYDSTLPGPDADHWWSADLRADNGQPWLAITAPLTPTLPLASGSTMLTISGSAATAGSHTLRVQAGGATAQVAWRGTGNWTQTFTFNGSVTNAQITLLPRATADHVLIDSVTADRPAMLDAAHRGAIFSGAASAGAYTIINASADATLYDVSDPRVPRRFTLPSSNELRWTDAPDRRYLLLGPGTLHTPELVASDPIDLSAPTNADVIMIAPSAFHAALTPLVVRRQAQGHRVRVVDPQAIYDAWSYGQVSPDAIRTFLRYAASFAPAPQAVLLVGDGTSDPHNYSGRNNANVVPPYLAMVDPYIGETACDTCYVQLDGDDPLLDPLPDLAIGRLPVKSAAELAALVAKLIRYETQPGDLQWRSRVGYIADDADDGGDFAALAEQSAADQPAAMHIARVYYDPHADQIAQPWREPDAVRAHRRTLDMLNAGGAFVNYVGHSYYWQWATTDLNADPPSLLGLYDADALANVDHLPIVLEMTCYTAAFHTPAFSGTTIDERLLLARGGAAAVWGPTGLSVARGHDALQHGFYAALWNAPVGAKPSLGALTTAGYLDVFAHGCCPDLLRTFVLLGDPLTTPQALVPQRAHLPLTGR